MRLSLSLIALLVIYESCKKKSACNPEFYSTVFEAGKQLKDTSISYESDSMHSYTEAPGSNLVFRYSHGQDGCDIVDPGDENLNFEINSTLTGFEYRDSSIFATKCYYYVAQLFFNQYSIQKISKGILKGIRLSATKWNITANIQTDFGSPVSFNKTFTLAQ